MSSGNRVVLCTYRYDPTDRLADCVPAGQGGMRLFYQKSRLATQIQGQIQHSLLRTDEHLLAHLSVENNQSDSALLLTDQQQSVIAAQGLALAYTPYGHRHPSAGPMNLPGFTGQRLDPVTGHYLLGNGYRAFNPVLMRFNSPDSLSPFGEGGLNAYGYCAGDPVNRVDPSGHIRRFFRRSSDTQPDAPQILYARRRVQHSTSVIADTSSGPPAPHRSVNSVLGQDVAQPTSSQTRPMFPPPYTESANQADVTRPYETRWPYGHLPPYEASPPYFFGPPPPYARSESPSPFSGAYVNSVESAPVSTSTRLNPALVRMNDAIQGLRRRGVLE
ncbi:MULTISPECIES: RHS repeat-associated core domain-containing protein [Pseudomonas syringae group]|uniref:Yd repeat-containing protein n=1 Tax=Pseudomonas syringae pv. persicae TaxID=237306 RepID=A0AB38ELJ5_9PSED|nr:MULTISPECIES: RHS repeat-associated core domain-containing protein [Pseudomonas syringae group]SOQ15034.1 yd repeat-containing protein [Pseudomonas syringae pv. persicae]SOQ15094.1 yd repeat-containing protein [Pseudomonas syringae pv. persicae]